MRVIGTAGHVDHGKSTLISALTGTHPDRLKEEQEREMTIDLGFGWMKLPTGEEIGIIDVPGHRDFIANMLAGVGGIDAVLLVIAADEGIMPQSREHLAIINLLGISSGLVVLNKIDLAQDPDWLTMMEEEIRSFTRDTVLADAPIVRVSAKTGEGIPTLIQNLENVLSTSPARTDLGRPRLPVDRVFTMPGFGTVVTGTLLDGHFSLGDEIEILPSKIKGRIRGLQTHKQKEDRAFPGSRVAINISGIELNELHRGDVVTVPGAYKTSRMLDVQFRVLPDASSPLQHDSELKIFLGTSETITRVRLLGSEILDPGQEGWLQLEMQSPLLAARRDRFILRRPSPGETIGGGIVLNPNPQKRYKRFDNKIIKNLINLENGDQQQVILQYCNEMGPATVKVILSRSHMDENEGQKFLSDLINSGSLVVLDDSPQYLETLVASDASLRNIKNEIKQNISIFHQDHPLRSGIQREELKSRSHLPLRVFNAVIKLMEIDKEIKSSMSDDSFRKSSSTPRIALSTHMIRFSNSQDLNIQKLMNQFSLSPYSPPSIKDCKIEVGEDVFDALVETNILVQVSAETAFRKTDYDYMVGKITNEIQKRGRLSLAEARDMFQTSRRYIQAMLEHLDEIGVTVRQGEARILRKK